MNPENTIVQFWTGNQSLLEKALERGLKVVNNSCEYTYLNYNYDKIVPGLEYAHTPIPVSYTHLDVYKRQAKFRASYGWLGNQNVGYYEYISNMSFYECTYLLEGKKTTGVGSPSPISDDLTWEKVNTMNLGLDLAFFKNRLTISGDIYRRNTKDMLTKGKTLPGVFGVCLLYTSKEAVK